MTQEQLAHLVGVSLGTIQGTEQGKTVPRYETAEKIDSALDAGGAILEAFGYVNRGVARVAAVTQPDEILLPSLVELAHQVERIDLDANRQHVATLATNAKIDDLVEVVADLSRRLAVLEARPGRRSSD